GKVAGEGRPPAKEMTSGRSVTLRISRMAELVSAWARQERVNEVAMAKCTGPQCDRRYSGGRTQRSAAPAHSRAMAARRVTVLMLRAVPLAAAGSLSLERAIPLA